MDANTAGSTVSRAGGAPLPGPNDRRRYLIPDDAVPIIIDACRRGVPETKVAQALSINYRTWMRVRVEDERVAEVLAESRKIEEEELVTLLLDKARNGDLTATIFALKSRHSYRDIGIAMGGSEQKVNVTINLPAPAANEEEFGRFIEITATKEDDDSWLY